MLLIMRISYEAFISLFLVVSLNISVNHANHLFIFKSFLSISLIHNWVVAFISGWYSTKSSLSWWSDYLIFLTGFLSCRFRDELIFTSSSDCLVGDPEVVGWCFLERNLGLLLRSDLLFLALANIEEIDPIYISLVSSIMFNILKGLEIFTVLMFHRSIYHYLVIWHVLVLLLGFPCQSFIWRILK